MRKYRIVITWSHHKYGPQMEKLTGEGTSARRALNKTLLGFFRDKDKRPIRRDAHEHFHVDVMRRSKA